MQKVPVKEVSLERYVLAFVPHDPLIGSGVLFALQDALVPPLLPLHVHVQGPVPDTLLAVPNVHSPEVGADEYVPPSAEPHCPFNFLIALQNALLPVFNP